VMLPGQPVPRLGPRLRRPLGAGTAEVGFQFMAPATSSAHLDEYSPGCRADLDCCFSRESDLALDCPDRQADARRAPVPLASVANTSSVYVASP